MDQKWTDQMTNELWELFTAGAIFGAMVMLISIIAGRWLAKRPERKEINASIERPMKPQKEGSNE
jgi:hypothetical protein